MPLTLVSRMSSVRLPRRRADSSGRRAGPSALMHCCRKPPTALLCNSSRWWQSSSRVSSSGGCVRCDFQLNRQEPRRCWEVISSTISAQQPKTPRQESHPIHAPCCCHLGTSLEHLPSCQNHTIAQHVTKPRNLPKNPNCPHLAAVAFQHQLCIRLPC